MKYFITFESIKLHIDNDNLLLTRIKIFIGKSLVLVKFFPLLRDNFKNNFIYYIETLTEGFFKDIIFVIQDTSTV